MVQTESPLNTGPFTTIRRVGQQDARVIRLYPQGRHAELSDWIAAHNAGLDVRDANRIPMYIPRVMVLSLDSTNAIYARVEALGDGETIISYSQEREKNKPLIEVANFMLPRTFGDQYYIPSHGNPNLEAWQKQFKVATHAVAQAPKGVTWVARNG